MAQRVQVVLLCDLHGDETEGTQTITFGLDGSTYEIDVCDQHAAEMRQTLGRYAGPARRASAAGRAGGRRAARQGRGAGGRQQTSEIRAWARERGLPVNERGRIPASIVEQFNAAH